MEKYTGTTYIDNKAHLLLILARRSNFPATGSRSPALHVVLVAAADAMQINIRSMIVLLYGTLKYTWVQACIGGVVISMSTKVLRTTLCGTVPVNVLPTTWTDAFGQSEAHTAAARLYCTCSMWRWVVIVQHTSEGVAKRRAGRQTTQNNQIEYCCSGPLIKRHTAAPRLRQTTGEPTIILLILLLRTSDPCSCTAVRVPTTSSKAEECPWLLGIPAIRTYSTRIMVFKHSSIVRSAKEQEQCG